MLKFIIAGAVLSIALAGVLPDEGEAQITKYENDNDGAGNYNFSYETSNGIKREETGHLVNAGKEDEHIAVQGSYSYTDVEGKLVVVSYTADENGFQFNPPVLGAPQVISALPPAVVASLLGR